MVDSTSGNPEQLQLHKDDEELAISVSDSLSNNDQESNQGGGGKSSQNHTSTMQPPTLNLTGTSPFKNEEKGGGGPGSGGMSSMTIDDFGGPSSPKIVTEEKLQCYHKFKGVTCMVEGPEFAQDFSYFL